MELIMLCLYDFFFLHRLRFRLVVRSFFRFGCRLLFPAAEITHEADDNPQNDTQEGPGERPEERIEKADGRLVKRHPVPHPHQKENCIEITEYEIARKNPENDPGCGADSFAPENPREKADDLPKHAALVLQGID